MSRFAARSSVLARARAQWGLLTTLTLTLAVSGMAVGVVWSLVDDGNARALMAAAAQADSPRHGGAVVDLVSVTVSVADDAASRTLASTATAVIERAMGDVPSDVSVWAQSPIYPLMAPQPRGAYVLDVDDLDTHVHLVEGRLPSAPGGIAPGGAIEVAIPSPTAAALNLGLGDRVDLYATTPHQGQDQVPALTVTVVGVVELTGPVWQRDLLQGAGAATDRGWMDTYGPLLTARGVLVSGEAGPTAEPAVAAARVSVSANPDWSGGIDVVSFAQRVSSVSGQLSRDVGDDVRSVVVHSGAPQFVADAKRDLAVTRTVVMAASAITVALAVTVLALAGGALVSRRDSETALWRTRGASAGQLAARAAKEAALLAAMAAVVGTALAIGVYAALLRLPLTRQAWPLPVEAVPFTAAGVVAVVVGAAVPAVTLVAVAALASGGAQRRSVGAAGRAGVDVAVVLLAVVAGWHQASGGEATTNVDVVAVLAPVLAVLAAAAVVLRVMPLVARVSERVARGSRGVVAALAGWSLARGSASRGAFAFSLCAASVVLCLVTVSTWTASANEQATIAVGADAVVAAELPVGAGASLARASCPAVSAVMDQPVSLGSRATPTRLIGIDAAAAPVLLSSTVPRTELRDLATANGATETGLPVAGGALTVSVQGGFDQASFPVWGYVSALVDAGHGDQGVSTTAKVPLDGVAHTVVLDVPDATPDADPWTIVGFTVTVVGGTGDDDAANLDIALTGTTLLGSLTITPHIEGSAAATGHSPQPWFITTPGSRGTLRALAASTGDTLHIDLASRDDELVWAPTTLVAMVREQPASIPVVMAQSLADSLGVQVADTLQLQVQAVPLTVQIVAVVPAIPSHPHEPAMLADIGTVWRSLASRGVSARVTDAWWVSLECGGTTDSLAAFGPVTTVTQARDDATHGPLRTAAWLSLWIAAGAAVLLSVAGAAVRAQSHARSRAVVVARLRGVGMSRRAASAMELSQHALVVSVAALLGTVAGGVAAWLLAPVMMVAPGGASPNPAAHVVFGGVWPWWVVLVVVAAGAAAAVCVSVPSVRSMTRHAVAQTLRTGGDV